jgi:hypothetical protein
MPSQLFSRAKVRVAAAGIALATLVSLALADYSTGGGGGYTVRPGDSLWAIATSHHTTVWELASVNHMDPYAILLIGRHLVIPGAPVASADLSRGTTGGAPYSRAALPASVFCSRVSEGEGTWGILPAQLSAAPDRLYLRPLFEHWAAHYGVSAPLLEAVAWQESGWQQGTVSSTGARGVGQIMPGTAAFISTFLVGEPLDVASVSDNIRMSAAFLAYLSRVEGNSRCATIAAYYEGPLNLSTVGVLPDTQVYVADVEALIPRFS